MDMLSQVRGLIVQEARRRAGKLITDDGGINARALAEELSCATSVVSRILTARIATTATGHYNPPLQLVNGLQRWLNLNQDDLWSAIEAATPVPPIH